MGKYITAEFGKMCRVAVFGVLVSVSCLISIVECRPYYRWSDYDYFAPQVKSIQDTTGAPQTLGTVNPLRPYEPWVLDCHLLFHEKEESDKRHPRCKEVDETNEKEYAKFLLHVQQWEEAYPDRAERWNTRFPEAKETEKKRYAQLKIFSESHTTPNVFTTTKGETVSSTSATPSQRTDCTKCRETANADSGNKNSDSAEPDDPQR